MITIGLTGGIGSGKSRAADRFAEHGAAIIDADQIAHLLTGPEGAALGEISRLFGSEVIDRTTGALDRAAMRTRVFGDSSARKQLEAILHPAIRRECLSQLEQTKAAGNAPYTVLVIPLLTESTPGIYPIDRIAVVDCSVETQVRRVMERNRLAREEVLRIIEAQATRGARLAVADDVISNDGDLASLLAQVDELDMHYRKFGRESFR